MEYSKSTLISPAVKVFVINLALGFVTPGLISKSVGFWWYFSWLHILVFLLLGWVGNVIGIGGVKSKLKFKSQINQQYCLLLWRITFFTAIFLVAAWITVLLPNLIKLISKEIVVGIFLSILYLLLIFGAAIITAYVSLPRLWAYGSIFLLFFNRLNAVVILSSITFIGFGIGYYFGNANL